MPNQPLSLFEGYGVELEYMIVDQESLSVAPIADKLLYSVNHDHEPEVERGALCWSNELVLHVVELKTNGPAKNLVDLIPLFQDSVNDINKRLSHHQARLMPTAMHPWMNPHTETVLWPYEYNQVYESYNRIFNCQGHGWSNLQSVHLNLPFANDDEFARLHAAIRFLLPIMPALCASSPLIENQRTDFLDTRMVYYRDNSKKVPQVTGLVIPEKVSSMQEYHDIILQPLYQAISPYDPDGILQDEWLNARGAIARFDRQTIEIRVLDIQEHPAADLAVVWLISKTLQLLCEAHWIHPQKLNQFSTKFLADLLNQTIKTADETPLPHDYVEIFGLNLNDQTILGLWKKLFDAVKQHFSDEAEVFMPLIDKIFTQKSLARRIIRSLPEPFTQQDVKSVYENLCGCLHAQHFFQYHTNKNR